MTTLRLDGGGSGVQVAPHPADPQPRSAVPTALQRSGLRLKETEDTYPRVVVRDGKHRIFECRDRTQWILQRRDGERRWASISYCRWRVTLLRLCKRWSEDALAVVRALPQGIEEPDSEPEMETPAVVRAGASTFVVEGQPRRRRLSRDE